MTRRAYWLLLAVMMLPLPCWAETIGTTSPQAINAYLSGSPLAGLGQTFFDEGIANDVDPRLIVGIAVAESSLGRNLCVSFNAWNWFWDRTCQKSPFSSFENGIGTVSRFIGRSWFRKGYDSIPEIWKRYCAAGCENWARHVTTAMQTLGAEVIYRRPTFSCGDGALDDNEVCDPGGYAGAPPANGVCLQPCRSTCECPCGEGSLCDNPGGIPCRIEECALQKLRDGSLECLLVSQASVFAFGSPILRGCNPAGSPVCEASSCTVGTCVQADCGVLSPLRCRIVPDACSTSLSTP